MQQTKSYWHVVAALGVVGAFVASACVVTTSTDGNTAGDAGETNTTAGSPGAGSSAGGASAGSSSTAGTAGTVAAGGDAPTSYQCDTGDAGAPPGTKADCSPDPANPTDVCAVCVQAHCCAEFGECYATEPGNQCGYGGPNDGGEYACVHTCLQAGFQATGVDDEDLRGGCVAQCTTNPDHHSTHDCGTLIGTQTNALLACLSDNCRTQCIGG